MEKPHQQADERPARLGYAAAIVASAIGHAAAVALAFFVLPGYLHPASTAPATYSVKIVDQLPAGDLGTHLPALSSGAKDEPKQEAPAVPPPEQVAEAAPKGEVTAPPQLAPPEDKSALALNTIPSRTETPTPVETSTPEPTAAPPPSPSVEPTPAPPAPTPKPQPTQARLKQRKAQPNATLLAKAERTPSVEERLNKVREQLMAEHLKKEATDEDEEESDEDTDTNAPSGGGPVASNSASAGKGYGVGPGTGSAGIQSDPVFLLYYQTVQERVKKAWSFSGGSSDLTTIVSFAIAPDGSLNGIKITKSSNDAAFDDSVVRAIRHAAPFPAPPEKYRAQFANGIDAVFRLGELSA